MKVFNIFKNVIYEYKPILYNAHITPQTLLILVHNQHCWKLNDDLAALRYKHIDNNITRQICVSKYFNFRRFDKELKTEEVHTNCLNDVIRKVKQPAKEAKQYKDMYDVPIEPKRVNFLYQKCIYNILIDMEKQNILQKYICKME